MMGPTCSLVLWKVSSVIFLHQSVVAKPTLLLGAGLHPDDVPLGGSRGLGASACIKPGIPHGEHCASATTSLVLTRRTLLFITSLPLLISPISPQAMGFLSINSLLALFSSHN